MAAPFRMRYWKRWLAIGILGMAVVVVGAPYVYIHFVEGKAPAPLTLSSRTAASSPATATPTGQATGSTDGTWNVADGSLVGYRVKEILFGQSNIAVGRTSQITGAMTVSGTTITAATFTVDMTTVTSDQSRRDAQFNGRIMETSAFSTATFKLTKSIDLGAIPEVGADRTFKITGDLTLHGVTKSVTFEVTGRYTGSAVQIAGSIPITFADWNIPNPSFFGSVTTDDNGVLEFALNFTHA